MAPIETEYLIRFGVLLAALISLVILVYSPGITGPLLFDDYTNLSPVGEDGGVSSWSTFIQFIFGNPSGPSGRPVSMLSFLIDARNWPPNIASFKYTNIMIHVLSGLMLCWFVSELMQILGLSAQRSALLGLLVAAVWMLHPFNGSTTLYVVQRMTQLMTFFALTSLLCYLKGRRLVLSSPAKGLLLLCLCLFPFALLSVLSKENGVLILFLILVFEFSIFRSQPKNTELVIWFRAGIVAPLVLFGMYLLLTFPDAIAGYEFRHFSLFERLLTQSRILVIYLGKIVLPIDAGVNLFGDDLRISESLFNPLTTLFSVLLLAGLATAGLYWRKAQPVLFFGIAWFFVMHLLESTYLPLELYFEHRNYMSMIGPLITCVWYLNSLMQTSHWEKWKRAGMPLIAIALMSMAWTTWQHSRLWGHTGDLLAHWAENQPNSSRAQITYADLLSRVGDMEGSLLYLERAHELNPREITTLLHMWNRACEAGVNPPYSLENIGSRGNLEYYHNDINFHLTALIENLAAAKCDFPSYQVMRALFDSVAALPLADDRRASYHVLYSDLFVHYRQLDPALIQLRYAFDLHPIPNIPIRQAMISASAGRNSDALIFLERARAADKEQSILLPSFEDDIVAMETDINARLDSR
ncbi:MAG: hypothetical protein JKY29_11430 [Gammaproteobacteria bacterium]|nr:hypothetical protein [Gammaproteobacteria bacterium]